MSDEITLTLPREPDFHRVAHLVLGGLAVRMNLTIEKLEDLQLALDALLDRGNGDGRGGEITVQVSLGDEALETLVGPLDQEVLDELDHDAGDDLGLRRVLESTVDHVEIEGDSIRLVKRVAKDG